MKSKKQLFFRFHQAFKYYLGDEGPLGPSSPTKKSKRLKHYALTAKLIIPIRVISCIDSLTA